MTAPPTIDSETIDEERRVERNERSKATWCKPKIQRGRDPQDVDFEGAHGFVVGTQLQSSQPIRPVTAIWG